MPTLGTASQIGTLLAALVDESTRKLLRAALEVTVPAEAAALLASSPRPQDALTAANPQTWVASAWQQALLKADKEAQTAAGALAAEIDGLRARERAIDPYATAVFQAAVQSLALLAPSASEPAAADTSKRPASARTSVPANEAAKRAIEALHVALAQALRGFRFGRDERVARVLDERRKTFMDTVARSLAPSLAATVLPGAAAGVLEGLQAKLRRVREAAEQVELARSPQRVAQRAGAEAATAIARGRTAAEHAYSRPPESEVFLRFAAGRKPGLLTPAGQPGPGFWPAYGAWLAHHADYLPETAPGRQEEGIAAFLNETLREVFPADLGLAALYRGAGLQPPAPGWAALTAARVTVGPNPHPTTTSLVVEAPRELHISPAFAAVPGLKPRDGVSTQRVRLLHQAHRTPLADFVRGANLSLESATEALAACAPTPQLRKALLQYLPSVLLEKAVEPAPEGPLETRLADPTVAAPPVAAPGTTPPEFMPAASSASGSSVPLIDFVPPPARNGVHAGSAIG